jgi:hypothetical protein
MGGQCCVLSETCHYYIISGWKVVFVLQTIYGHCLKVKEPKRKKANCNYIGINHSTGAIGIPCLISEVESDISQLHRLCTP